MFIINIEDINKKNMFICNKEYSEYLNSNGFCLLGIDKEKYFYYKTDELNFFLRRNGGDKK